MRVSLMVESFRLSPVIKWLFIGTFQKFHDLLETFILSYCKQQNFILPQIKIYCQWKICNVFKKCYNSFTIVFSIVFRIPLCFFQIELWIHFFNTLFKTEKKLKQLCEL